MMNPLFRSLLLFFCMFGLAAAANINESVVAKIVLKKDGALFFDGRKVEVRDLDALLSPIKEKNGDVWYYRENPESEPHPVAVQVLKAVVAKRLPIRLFSKEDFSEVIGPDGKPRKLK